MAALKPADHKSGLLEKSNDEPEGTLAGLLKAAKKEQKILLTEVRTALKYSRRATKMARPYRTDIFGESFGIRGGFRHRRFKRMINEALQLAISAKIHIPAIELVSTEVRDWLIHHKADTTAAELLPADEEIIADVGKAKELLESAVKNLTELDLMTWGTAQTSSILSMGMYYIPVEHPSEHETGLNFRADWIKPLKLTNDSLEHFETAVENIFKLQKEINRKYRV